MARERIPTGVPGLDSIIDGGFPAASTCLIKGGPGTGKTTVGLQFLVEGVKRGEKCLLLGLAETHQQLAFIAESYGWTLDGIEVQVLRRAGEPATEKGYTVFTPAEVELEEIWREIIGHLERVKPTRLVLDSLSELRMLSDNVFRYRRMLLAFSDMITAESASGLLLDVVADEQGVLIAETLVGGVISLEQLAPAYGGVRRRIWVQKLRGSATAGGHHDYAITEAGVVVYPRLVAAEYRREHSVGQVRSGNAELDALLGGGIDRGTSSVLVGPSGSGKSTVATQFLTSAASRGEPGTMLCFDESPVNVLIRSQGLSMGLTEYVHSGVVRLIPVDPAELSTGELGCRVRSELDRGIRMLVIDSLNGYVNALPDERFLEAHMHELLAYLAEQGVATVLTVGQHGFFGVSDGILHISYIADTVILLRFFEKDGAVKKAISVVKKRTGPHEETIRQLELGPEGLRIGSPLHIPQGALGGSGVGNGRQDSDGPSQQAR